MGDGRCCCDAMRCAARQVLAPPPSFLRPPLKFLRLPGRFSPLPQAFCGHPSSFCGHPSSFCGRPAGFRPSPNIFAATPQDFAGNPHDLLKACARKLDALHIRDLRALASACCSRFCRKRRERNAYNEPPSLASLPLSLEAQSSLLLPFAVALLRVLQRSIESHSCACCIRHNAYNVNTLHGSLHTLTWSVFALPLPIALVLPELQRRHRRLDAQALHLHRIQLRLLSILYASRHAVLLQ